MHPKLQSSSPPTSETHAGQRAALEYSCDTTVQTCTACKGHRSEEAESFYVSFASLFIWGGEWEWRGYQVLMGTVWSSACAFLGVFYESVLQVPRLIWGGGGRLSWCMALCDPCLWFPWGLHEGFPWGLLNPCPESWIVDFSSGLKTLYTVAFDSFGVIQMFRSKVCWIQWKHFHWPKPIKLF